MTAASERFGAWLDRELTAADRLPDHERLERASDLAATNRMWLDFEKQFDTAWHDGDAARALAVRDRAIAYLASIGAL